MIGTLAKALGIDTLVIEIGLAVLFMIGLFGYGLYEHHKGYRAGVEYVDAKVAAAVAKEQKRQADANAKVQAEFEQKLKDIEAENLSLNKTLQENADAAHQDPGRDRPALGVGSVRRLNKIR